MDGSSAWPTKLSRIECVFAFLKSNSFCQYQPQPSPKATPPRLAFLHYLALLPFRQLQVKRREYQTTKKLCDLPASFPPPFWKSLQPSRVSVVSGFAHKWLVTCYKREWNITAQYVPSWRGECINFSCSSIAWKDNFSWENAIIQSSINTNTKQVRLRLFFLFIFRFCFATEQTYPLPLEKKVSLDILQCGLYDGLTSKTATQSAVSCFIP